MGLLTHVVTGGAGFIGSHLAWRLVKQGASVTIVDNFSTGRRENLNGLEQHVRVATVDVGNTEALRHLFAGADVVFHQAALPSVSRSIKEPMVTNRGNVEGTLSVLIAARDAGVRRVVIASSSSVYGDVNADVKQEDMRPNPLSPYAVTKLAAELYAKVFTHVYGLETVSLRYFNVFGPRQDPQSQYAAVIPRFITSIMCRERPTIHGDGGQSRDFTYVDNVVEANLLAASASGVAGETLNVGCGHAHTINELVALLGELLGVSVQPQYGPPRAGDIRHSVASIDKARRLLEYRPGVLFREGLENTVKWYTSEGTGPSDE